MKKKGSGGKRNGSGRKKIKDKKIPLTVYVKGSFVKRLGKTKAKRLAISAIEDSENNFEKIVG